MYLEHRRSTEDLLIKQASDLYLSGLTIKEAATSLNRSYSYIQKKLKRARVPIRPIPGRTRTYPIDENFFELINRKRKGYWLGFLAADGCIHITKTKGRKNSQFYLILNLSIKDKEILELFKKDVGTTYPIQYKDVKLNGKIYKSVRLSITSKKLCLDLINKGVVPRKSLILKPPKNIPPEFISHWIRGYFDGDGCVDIKKIKRSKNAYLRITIISTRSVLKFIQSKLGGIGRIRQPLGASIWKFWITKQADVEKFKNYIYEDASIYLDRKFEKFKERPNLFL